jgi:large subunit ribosomal protein L30
MTEKTIKTEELASAPKAAKKTATKAPKATKTAKPAKAATSDKIKITLIKSLIGRLEAHKASARGLGLKKIRQTVEVANTVENRGMINAISYLLKCEG